ncbi:MAG: hypothetical protein IPJ75_07045 [Ignavibacteriales bacterium]|nr:hypothetical protein [Ignavibacteriales bacterium]
MLFSSTELSGQTVVDPFLRFSGIDRWQGLTYSRSNNYVGYSFTEWQTVDSVLFDSIMFYQRGNSFHGFQASTNKYYLLENGVKKLYLDFSVPTGSTFTGVIGGGVPVVVSGSENIRYFNAHYGFWPRTEQELTYTKNLGVTKDYIYMVQSSNWGEYTTTLLSQLWLSLNGDTLYVDHGYTPYLSFNPIVSPSVTYSNHFEYSAGHTLNYFMYQYATTFNFNDSMFSSIIIQMDWIQPTLIVEVKVTLVSVHLILTSIAP